MSARGCRHVQLEPKPGTYMCHRWRSLTGAEPLSEAAVDKSPPPASLQLRPSDFPRTHLFSPAVEDAISHSLRMALIPRGGVATVQKLATH